MGYLHTPFRPTRSLARTPSAITVFVSHKQEDSDAANRVAKRLADRGLSPYIDTIDPAVRSGDDLADHLLRVMSECTDLIAVVSQQTKESWWVPWEIGVACEKDFPLATYAAGRCNLPEYLKKWPYLETLEDVDRYAEVRQSVRQRVTERRRLGLPIAGTMATTFHRNLKSALNQPF